MKVIKNINNNVSLCLDSKGREVIAFGKGIGFAKPPYEIPLSKIQRTFYDVNENYLSVLALIPEEIINLATEIVNYANQKLDNRYAANVIFALADHIQFAVQREKEHIHIKLPVFYEVQNAYPIEMKIGLYAVDLINRRLQVALPGEEAANIVLHLLNYEVKEKNGFYNSEKSVIEKCADLVEQIMEIQIDKTGFNYFRFVTHLLYLLERVRKNEMISTENEKLFSSLKQEYPKAYQCSLEIDRVLDRPLNEEELLYLILHINRLCDREDCYQ